MNTTNANETTDVSAEDIITSILNDILQAGDFYSIDIDRRPYNNGHIWYSRYCTSGAYEGVCGYSLLHTTMTLQKNHVNCTSGTWTFDIADPDSFAKIGDVIKIIVNTMQTDRTFSISNSDISNVYVRRRGSDAS
jgi:hypothetical protein